MAILPKIRAIWMGLRGGCAAPCLWRWDWWVCSSESWSVGEGRGLCGGFGWFRVLVSLGVKGAAGSLELDEGLYNLYWSSSDWLAVDAIERIMSAPKCTGSSVSLTHVHPNIRQEHINRQQRASTSSHDMNSTVVNLITTWARTRRNFSSSC